METPILVEIGHPSLRQAIDAQLRAALRQPGWDALGRRSVVVATTRDLTPEQCRERIEQGAVVLVLAAFPSAQEARLYRHTGALYGPMTAGDVRWIDCLRQRVQSSSQTTVSETAR